MGRPGGSEGARSGTFGFVIFTIGDRCPSRREAVRRGEACFGAETRTGAASSNRNRETNVRSCSACCDMRSAVELSSSVCEAFVCVTWYICVTA